MFADIEPPFPEGTLVVLPKSIDFTREGEVSNPVHAVMYPSDMTGCSMMSTWGMGVEIHPFLFPYVAFDDVTDKLGWVNGLNLSNEALNRRGEDDEAMRTALEAMLAFRSIGMAARMFGLTETEPMALRPRNNAERKQRLRDAARSGKAPDTLKVRYLRDPHGEIAVDRRVSNETGRHVRPHWRRGHFRNVRYGKMDLEERPTRARYIPPVLINSHLGTPQRSMYQWGKNR
jgi:hypothetical protein